MHILRRRSELLEADSLNKAPESWVCLNYWALVPYFNTFFLMEPL